MTNFADDLFLGPPALGSVFRTGQGTPSMQIGAGPMGRVHYLNIVPLTAGTANIAALQAPTSGTAMTLTAGTGITAGVAPDGSGATVYQTDVERAISLTSTSNLSGINFLITGFNRYGQKLTQLRAGPNNNTVNTLKGFASVLSVVPQGTSASTVSIGTADIFTMTYKLIDIGYIGSVKWAGALAQDAGTAVAADSTSPATSTTGDNRGTYAPSSASNGTRRLVIALHVDGTQCGPTATFANLYGVTPA